MTSKATHFPEAALRRFSAYLEELRNVPDGQTITVAEMAKAYQTEERELRRELAALTGSGELRNTYPVSLLVKEIEYFLGYHNISDAALVGFGPLGQALTVNEGFAKNGINICAVFDPEIQEEEERGEIRTLPLSKMDDIFQRMHIHLGVVATPPSHAQSAVDALVAAGALAIWNISGAPVEAPSPVLVESETFGEHEDVAHNERTALSLVVLARHLAQRMGW